MISLIIVFYNYFTWLFTNNMPMEHIITPSGSLLIYFFSMAELLIEVSLFLLIMEIIESRN